jgi:lipopolysaccharide/colanic/teichoic acid biosynthesis glycosyltransferase
MKRSLDVLLAAIGLALLAPVWFAIAVWIKLDSPGPVFFRQERVGRHAQVFRIRKLSIVGPRPEVPQYVALYPPATRELVLSIRPGITDDAAILFRDESQLLAAAADPHTAYVCIILPKKLALYEQYVRTRSLPGDFAIIWRTLVRIARQ